MGLDTNLNFKFDPQAGLKAGKDSLVNSAKTAAVDTIVNSIMTAGAGKEVTASGARTAKMATDQATTVAKYNEQRAICTAAIEALINFAQTGKLDLTQIQNTIQNTIINSITMKNEEGEQVNQETQTVLDRNKAIVEEIQALNGGSATEGMTWEPVDGGSEEVSDPSGNSNGESKPTKMKMVINPNNPNADQIQKLLDEYNGNLDVLTNTLQPKQTEIQTQLSQDLATGLAEQAKGIAKGEDLATVFQNMAKTSFQTISKSIVNTIFGNRSSMLGHEATATTYSAADTKAAAAKTAEAAGSTAGAVVSFGATAANAAKAAIEATLFGTAAGMNGLNIGAAGANMAAGQTLGEAVGNWVADTFTNKANELLSAGITDLTTAIAGEDVASYIAPALTENLQIRPDDIAPQQA